MTRDEIANLVHESGKPVETLASLLGPELPMPDGNVEAVPANVRRMSAHDIISLAGKLQERIEFAERLARIEARQAAIEAPRQPEGETDD